MPRNTGTVLEADSLLSGTFELFPLAEVLGLIERAAVSGVLVVRGREVDGSLYFVDGALCAGEIADLSGPVEGQQALEIRLLEVAVPLLRTRSAEFEFRPDVTPPWPAPLAVPVATVFEPARRIAREWSAIMTAIESFESVLDPHRARSPPTRSRSTTSASACSSRSTARPRSVSSPGGPG